MSTKLTLTINESVIEQAKRYAKKKGRSLSDLVENYLRAVSTEDSSGDMEITPLVKSMRGAFRDLQITDYESALTDILSEKYLTDHE